MANLSYDHTRHVAGPSKMFHYKPMYNNNILKLLLLLIEKC